MYHVCKCMFLFRFRCSCLVCLFICWLVVWFNDSDDRYFCFPSYLSLFVVLDIYLLLSIFAINLQFNNSVIYSPSDSSSALVNHSINGFVCSKKTDLPLLEWLLLYQSMIMSSVKTSALYRMTMILLNAFRKFIFS